MLKAVITNAPGLTTSFTLVLATVKLVVSTGVKLTVTFVMPAFGTFVAAAMMKPPNTWALLLAFVATLPARLEFVSACP